MTDSQLYNRLRVRKRTTTLRTDGLCCGLRGARLES